MVTYCTKISLWWPSYMGGEVPVLCPTYGGSPKYGQGCHYMEVRGGGSQYGTDAPLYMGPVWSPTLVLNCTVEGDPCMVPHCTVGGRLYGVPMYGALLYSDGGSPAWCSTVRLGGRGLYGVPMYGALLYSGGREPCVVLCCKVQKGEGL